MPSKRKKLLNTIRQQAGWESSFVAGRGNRQRLVVFQHPTDPAKRVVISSTRRLHYKDGRKYIEIDPDWKIPEGRDQAVYETAEYRVLAGGQDNLNFFNRNLIRYQRDNTTFRWTPGRQILWENRAGDTEVVRDAVNVVGQILDGDEADILRWQGAYGPGTRFDMVGAQDQVWKAFTVTAMALLGLPTIIGPGRFIYLPGEFSVDAGTRIQYKNNQGAWVNWNQVDDQIVRGAVRFVRNSDGRARFFLRKPFVKTDIPHTYGTHENQRVIVGGDLTDQLGNLDARVSWYRLRNDNGTLFIDSCFAWNMVRNLIGQVTFDPSVDTAPVDDDHDAQDNTYSSFSTAANIASVATYASGDVYGCMNYDISAIGATDTVDSATFRCSIGGVGTGIRFRVVEEADHTFPTTQAEASTARGNWSATTVDWASGDISSFTQNQTSASIVSLVEDAITAGGSVGEIGLWAEGLTSSPTGFYLTGYTGYEPDLVVETTASSARRVFVTG